MKGIGLFLLVVFSVSLPLFADDVPFKWNSDKQDFGVSLSNRGNLFFYSSRAGRGTDLYESQRIGGEFQKPVPLSALNSDFDDQSPFILPDEAGIFFSSNRDGATEFRTAGGVAVSRDIYFSKKIGDDWSEPERLADAINTEMM